MKNKTYLQKTINIIFLSFFLILLAGKFSYAQEDVKTNKETNLYDSINGDSIVSVNKGYEFEVIKKEGNWYLVKTHFGKITQAWLKESDIEKDVKLDIDSSLLKTGRLLIRDDTGDISNPDFCDLETLKINTDERYIYFLIKLAVGWQELFEKTKTTGSVGTIYLDTDNDKNTGYDGGIMHVNQDGTEQRKINRQDARIGADYKIRIDTGFRAAYGKSGISNMVPEVSYKLYSWNLPGIKWQYLEKEKALAEDEVIEVSIDLQDVKVEKGDNIKLIFDETNAFGENKYNVVNFSL